MDLKTDIKGQGVGRNVIGGIAAMIIMLLLSALIVTEVNKSISVTENVGGVEGTDDTGENLKNVVGDKIPVIFTLLAVLMIVVIAGVMLRSLGVF